MGRKTQITREMILDSALKIQNIIKAGGLLKSLKEGE